MANPLVMQNISFEQGLKGKAAVFDHNKKSDLAFALKENLLPERGTISAWVKPKWEKDRQGNYLSDSKWRTILSMPWEEETKLGSGAVWFWIYEGRLRADNNDFGRSYSNIPFPQSGDWTHVAFVWDDFRKAMYINGKKFSQKSDDLNLAQPQSPFLYSRLDFDRFFIGNYRGFTLNGALDEVRIYDAPLSDTEIKKLFHEFQPCSISFDRQYYFDDENFEISGMIKNISPETKLNSIYLKGSDGNPVVFTENIVSPPSSETSWKLKGKPLPAGSYSLVLRTENYDVFSCPILVFSSSYFSDDDQKHSSDIIRRVLKETVVPARLVDSQNITSQNITSQNITAQNITSHKNSNRFTHYGSLHKYSLNGKDCLETGSEKGERFAIRFPNLEKGKHYCFEIDFPDDKVRTVDMIAQSTFPDQMITREYDLQTGWFTGREYPVSNKIMTRQFLYWSRSDDVTLIFMSARTMPAGAAVSEIRVYEIQGDLPKISLEKYGDLSNDEKNQTKEKIAPEFSSRSLGIYFEDPAILYDFGVNGSEPAEFPVMMKRLCEYMKYSGQDLLAYPAVWYNGLIGDDYNPRNHLPNFLDAVLTIFDRKKLRYMATINQNNVSFTDIPPVTWRGIREGHYYDSIYSIHSTGTPHPGGWHNTPPIFNPLHSEVRKMILHEIDQILAVGRKHSSFKGIILHLPKHSLCSLGDIRAGYNDYLINAFTKETGIELPVDRKDPLRGKKYYEWLMTNAREKWIDWRCRKIGELYREIARKMNAVDPNLKLVINCFTPQHCEQKLIDEKVNDFWQEINRQSGIDAKYFADEPNIIIQQTLFPASYRTRHGRFPEDRLELLRNAEEKPGMYSSLKNSSNAWINLFDLYWEDPMGNPAKTPSEKRLPADWLKEHPWRVSTLNPAGPAAMMPYVMPLRYQDILGITRGGYLIGTYGLEEYLIPFAAACRALPAVPFVTASESTETVKIRYFIKDNTTWFYVVNTSGETQTIQIPCENNSVLNLGENKKDIVKNGILKVTLSPWSLQSFQMAAGSWPQKSHDAK